MPPPLVVVVDRTAEFGSVVNLGSGVNSSQSESQSSMTQDGLEIYFVRSDGYWQSDDLYRASRSSTSQPFGKATPVSELNTSGPDAYPCVSPDGLTLYFTCERDGKSHIWYAVRSSRSDPFGTPQPLTSVNSSSGEMAFSIRADGLAAYFIRATPAQWDIYETMRSSPTEDFGPGTLIAALTNPCFDSGPHVTADGNELYFYSDSRSGGRGGYDLWRSRRMSGVNSWPLYE